MVSGLSSIWIAPNSDKANYLLQNYNKQFYVFNGKVLLFYKFTCYLRALVFNQKLEKSKEMDKRMSQHNKEMIQIHKVLIYI